MLNIQEFLTEKNNILPDWFKTHEAFKGIDKVKKIFPSLGLTNFEETSEIENSDCSALGLSLLQTLSTYINNACYYFTNSKSPRYDGITHILKQTYEVLKSDQNAILTAAKKGGKLALTKDIKGLDDHVLFDKGMSIFKVYSYFADVLKTEYNYPIPELDSLNQFKEFSSGNMGKNLSIVFSSDGKDGAWDLTTMSMRGINSCQSWTGQYKSCLVGSVIDPYTAIIYTTAGTSLSHGTKMVRRCIVRFIVNRETNQPAIFIDRMYPAHDIGTLKGFKSALKAHLKSDIQILDSATIRNIQDYYIPNNNNISDLLKRLALTQFNTSGYHNQNNVLSYRDTFFEIKLKQSRMGLLDEAKIKLKEEFRGNLYKYMTTETNIMNCFITFLESAVTEELFDTIELHDSYVPSTLFKKACIKFFHSPSKFADNVYERLQVEMKKIKRKTIVLSGAKSLMIKNPSEDKKDEISKFIHTELNGLISKLLMKRWNTLFKNFKKTAPKKKTSRKSKK